MATETIIEIETVVDDLTAHEFEPPCELGDGPPDQPPNCDHPARWKMHRKPCCAHALYPALACDMCKEIRLMDRCSIECEFCGHVWNHAPDGYSYVEPLSRH